MKITNRGKRFAAGLAALAVRGEEALLYELRVSREANAERVG